VFTSDKSKRRSRPYLFSENEEVDGEKGRKEEVDGLVYSVVTHFDQLLVDFN
jgi:hypothetical protein